MDGPSSPNLCSSETQPLSSRSVAWITRRKTHCCVICGKIFHCRYSLSGHHNLHASERKRMRKEAQQPQATPGVTAPTNTGATRRHRRSILYRSNPIFRYNMTAFPAWAGLVTPVLVNQWTDRIPVVNYVDAVMKDLGPIPKGKKMGPDPKNHPGDNKLVERGQLDLNQPAFNGDDTDQEGFGYGQLDLNLAL